LHFLVRQIHQKGGRTDRLGYRLPVDGHRDVSLPDVYARSRQGRMSFGFPDVPDDPVEHFISLPGAVPLQGGAQGTERVLGMDAVIAAHLVGMTGA